ncbi:MAG: flagellar biosynthesis anti-sigma factor FlgM [Lachnospira sp.]|nr:flagellar biosynthesis anti-sigma factor FlgM [Lachnospira sp.]
MRIDAYGAVSQIYKSNGKINTTATTRAGKSDKLEISQFGKDYQVAKQALKNVPDVREDKVAEIKAQIDAGTYFVSSSALADKLLGNV